MAVFGDKSERSLASIAGLSPFHDFMTEVQSSDELKALVKVIVSQSKVSGGNRDMSK